MENENINITGEEITEPISEQPAEQAITETVEPKPSGRHAKKKKKMSRV